MRKIMISVLRGLNIVQLCFRFLNALLLNYIAILIMRTATNFFGFGLLVFRIRANAKIVKKERLL